MSCIKFPSSKTELVRTGNKENNYDQITAQIISAANEEFGQRNWSHSITNQTLDFIESTNGQYRAGCASIVKVQLKDGTFHEDIAYSFTEGSTKGSAIMRARLSSFNGAFKKALTCFSNRLLDKLNNPSNTVSVSGIKEANKKRDKCELNPPVNSIIPVTSLSVNENVPEVIFDVDSMPLSQTDALMNSVDLDNLVGPEGLIGNASKKSTLISKVPHDAAKESVNETNNCNPQLVSTKLAEVAQCLDTNHNLNNANNNNAELNSVSKSVVSTAMTEEEMRLERKRKQRERQEEFKRKEELKKKCSNGAVGAPPNARY